MTGKEFSQLCKNRGFRRMASGLYERCIGDGVYQTIYTGFRKYVDTSSPNYSDANRKSNYIDISLRSLYSYLPEYYFAPQRKCGGISPVQLKGNGSQTEIFHGIEAEYEQMLEFGFDLLDEVKTQERLLDLRLQIFRNHEEKRLHSLDLADLFLVTGQGEEANFELSHSLAHHMVGFRRTNEQLLRTGRYEAYCQELERAWETWVKRAAELWTWYLTHNHKELQRYLYDNFNRNIKWIEQYGIPIADDFRPRSIPDKY